MRGLRKKINDGLAENQVEGCQIQPNHQKTAIPQSTMAEISFGQAGFGLRQMHQSNGEEKEIECGM